MSVAKGIALPPMTRDFLAGTIARHWRDPPGAERKIAQLPDSLPAGQVVRLVSGGPFGWMIDGRLDQIDDRIALEVLENDRMSGPSHYRVWDDGTTEDLPTEQTMYALPPDCSTEEEQRIKDAYYAHNRRVGDELRRRGFYS